MMDFLLRCRSPLLLRFSDAGPAQIGSQARGPASENLHGTKPRVTRSGQCGKLSYGDLRGRRATSFAP